DVPLDLVAHSFAFRGYEAIPIAMHGELSGDQVAIGGRSGQCVAVAIHLDELPTVHEALQAVVQVAAVAATPESKLLYQLLKTGSSVRLSLNPVQDFSIARRHVSLFRGKELLVHVKAQ